MEAFWSKPSSTSNNNNAVTGVNKLLDSGNFTLEKLLEEIEKDINGYANSEFRLNSHLRNSKIKTLYTNHISLSSHNK